MTSGWNRNAVGCDKRLRAELRELLANPPPLCSANLRSDNLHLWTATIEGPPQSVYEGGKFVLDLWFSSDYPFKPPLVTFVTKIYHCNIGSGGTICMDLLGEGWSPAMKVSSLLISICSLLTDANPNSPLNFTAASLYRKNRALHDANARKYTEKYAKGN
ncbi:hypothetical protein JTE90_016374 [Oedothorax gibbosus]|uniref:E2 ubiquitin-conjugating enzyme n=1 Tax=Oedothorax gibbosus TaxID=931172 RepID=A0AAV6U8Y4_9ARAC|nr:hypothetical protein JTE90_016374 [Oedothorax gibbosus]